MTLKLKREAARRASRLGHELNPWQHDILNFLIVTECRVCGATVRIRAGKIRGEAVTMPCQVLDGLRHHQPQTEA